MSRLFFFLIAFGICASISAQRHTYLGIETGYKGDLYSLNDPGKHLRNNALPGLSYGINFGVQLKNNYFFETGLYPVTYWSGVNFSSTPFTSFGNAMETLQLPLRIKGSFSLFSEQLRIIPSIGLALAYNLSYINQSSGDEVTATGGGEFGQVDENGEILSTEYQYIYDEYTNYRKIFPLLEAGLQLGYQFRNGWMVSVKSSYNMGLLKVIESQVKYTVGDNPEQQATYQSKGNNLQFVACISYPLIRSLKQKEEYTIRKQNRKELIKNQEQKGYYVRIESGLTHNSFNNSMASITGNDEDGNLLWDKDFIYGFHFGRYISKDMAVNAGIYSHLFSNRFYLKDEQGNISGESSRTGGQGFYEIPVNAEYYFRLLDNRMSIVPSAGLTVVSHFVNTGRYENSTTNLDDFVTSGEPVIYVECYREKKVSLLLNAGINVEYSILPKLILALSTKYNYGFESLNRVQVTYDNGENSTAGDIKYTGTKLSFHFGLKVPFNA